MVDGADQINVNATCNVASCCAVGGVIFSRCQTAFISASMTCRNGVSAWDPAFPGLTFHEWIYHAGNVPSSVNAGRPCLLAGVAAVRKKKQRAGKPAPGADNPLCLTREPGAGHNGTYRDPYLGSMGSHPILQAFRPGRRTPYRPGRNAWRIGCDPRDCWNPRSKDRGMFRCGPTTPGSHVGARGLSAPGAGFPARALFFLRTAATPANKHGLPALTLDGTSPAW